MMRYLGLLALAVLAACGEVTTDRFAGAPVTGAARVSANTMQITFGGPAAQLARQAQSGSYRYGRFTVRREADGGQVIEGGVFTPPEAPPLWAVEQLRNRPVRNLILVDFIKKELHLYQRAGADWVATIGYAVVAPQANSLPRDVVEGNLSRIDLAPVWGVPASIRRDYAAAGQPLPAQVPFGDPRNMLGAARLEVAWNTPNWNLVRLHGARGYPAEPLGEVDTYGCVSLLDESLLGLINQIGGPAGAVRDGTVIMFHRRGVR
ncbi:hypothetical protein K2Q16_00770 [Patescibacteria group bacterium]|nr:hypothetical protein [Patescibacteria group bacterium]